MNEAFDILYVVLPCYNEEDNICDLILSWEAAVDRLLEKNISLRLIAVNDGSKDNTLKIVTELEKTYDNITALNHETNLGLGEAINTGINYALSTHKGKFLCIMDSDSTHSPEYIYDMIDKLKNEKLDCVIASRYREGSRIEGVPFIRKFLSYGARFIYTLFLRVPGVRDYTCGYRLYRITALKKLSKKYGKKLVNESGFACMMELIYKIHSEGFKIGEIPFVLKYQLKGGQSKMKVFNTIFRSLAAVKNLLLYVSHK